MLKYILAFISSITLLVLVSDYVTWEATMGGIVHTVADVTRTLMQLMFGWLFELFGWSMPNFVKDYLTVGLLFFRSFSRAVQSDDDDDDDQGRLPFSVVQFVILMPLFVLLWPLLIFQVGFEKDSTFSSKAYFAAYLMFFAELFFNEALKLIGLSTLPI